MWDERRCLPHPNSRGPVGGSRSQQALLPWQFTEPIVARRSRFLDDVRFFRAEPSLASKALERVDHRHDREEAAGIRGPARPRPKEDEHG